MLFTAEDTQFMRLAVDQAQQALYLSNPVSYTHLTLPTT